VNLYKNPFGSEMVGFERLFFAARSSLVMVQRTPSRVLKAAFAAAGSLPFSPNHAAQSSEARNAGMRSSRVFGGKGLNQIAFVFGPEVVAVPARLCVEPRTDLTRVYPITPSLSRRRQRLRHL
jgi:hypothetical protein